MTDTMTSQNIDISSLDILYKKYWMMKTREISNWRHDLRVKPKSVSWMNGTDSLLCSAGHRQSRALCSVCWQKSVL